VAADARTGGGGGSQTLRGLTAGETTPPAQPGYRVEAVVVRMQRLQHVSAALAESLTVDEVARVVLTSAATLPGVVRGGLALVAAGGRELRFVALHEDMVDAAQVPWCTLDATADLPLVVSVRTGEVLWFPTLGELAQQFPGLADRQASFGTRAFVTIPLRARDQTVGALMLCYADERPFDSAERAFLAAFAEQAGHALRRATAFEQQHTTAELLQRSLLPEALPDLPGLAMASHYAPAGPGVDIGGDWFDVLPLDDGAVLVVIGDVMGRGIPAATVMGQVRAALRAYALLEPAPEVVFARLDRLIATLGVPEQLVTVLAGLIDADRASVRFASAGHLPPLIADDDEPARLVCLPVGPPLGLSDGERQAVTVALPPGAILVMCTDGLVESADQPAEDGLERLRQALESAVTEVRLPRELCSRLIAQLDDGVSDDDQALMVIASTVGHPVRSDQCELPAETHAAALGRRWLRGLLKRWEWPGDAVEDAVLCLSEVVTNAVIHTGTPTRVVAEMDEHRLLVTVVDSGRRGAAVRRNDAEVDDVGGRGLAVLDAVASAWSSERRASGTVVWFELDGSRGGMLRRS
jgi:serine phosphatase RsbU (regulator of sigma subunit)/anti-sigma regulatory factor (Ser/Thr protein kinase)